MGDSGGLGATCGVLELEQVGCWMSLVPAFTERPWRKLRHEHLEYIKCEARQLRPCFGRNAYNTHGVAFFFFSTLRLKGSFLCLLYYSVRTSRTKVFFGNCLSLVRSTVAQNMEVCRRALRGGNRHRWLMKASSLLHR